MTPGQLRRRRRNLVIAQASKAGLSLRAIADAIGLAPSRIAYILEDLEEETQKGERRKISRSHLPSSN